MEIIISLIILLSIMQLGGSYLQGDIIYPIRKEKITTNSSIEKNTKHDPFECAVKFIRKRIYLLNTITLIDTQKDAQETLIQPQNYKFEG